MQHGINNVGGQHRLLFAFLAACYELTSVMFLCFSRLMAFVRGKYIFLFFLSFLPKYH